MKIFAISIVARVIGYGPIKVKFTTSCCRAVSEAEAVGLAYKRAHECMPSERFSDHAVSVLEIPEKWYELK